MAYSLLVFVPHEQTQRSRALSILKQVGTLGHDASRVGAAKTVMKLIANSLSAAKVDILDVLDA